MAVVTSEYRVEILLMPDNGTYYTVAVKRGVGEHSRTVSSHVGLSYELAVATAQFLSVRWYGAPIVDPNSEGMSRHAEK